METIQKDDLSLKDLKGFIGTTQYHEISLYPCSLTDGIVYIMNNGYSWLITNILTVIYNKPSIKKQEFLSIKLKVDTNKQTCNVLITDGNNKVLNKKHYGYTDAQIDLNLFFYDGVLMLAQEY